MFKSIVCVVSAFFVMLCLGSIYNWSMYVPDLKLHYGLSTFQTQIIFGTVIAVYPLTMIFIGKLHRRLSTRFLASASGILFFLGYGLANISAGNFYLIWIGIGLLGGISTGIGYMISLAVPVRWFPKKKGLVTGIVTAGFGAGAIIMAWFTNILLLNGYDILTLFLIIGTVLGGIIIVFAQFFRDPVLSESPTSHIKFSFKSPLFLILTVGIFSGTFAGLMIIGNLKPIGLLHSISVDLLAYSIAILSVANFIGRLFWGWMSDTVPVKRLIIFALIITGIASFIICHFTVSSGLFLILAFIIGFAFGANFVLFAKETMHLYGDQKFSLIYPFVFQGYGIAGLVGPSVGGILYDQTGDYFYPGIIAMFICSVAVTLYVRNMQLK